MAAQTRSWSAVSPRLLPAGPLPLLAVPCLLLLPPPLLSPPLLLLLCLAPRSAHPLSLLLASPRLLPLPVTELPAARCPRLGPPLPALPAEQMNLAFAQHEIISDHLTACLAWLEAQGTVHIGVFERELYVSVMKYSQKGL